MGHSPNCPTEWEARRRAQDDQSYYGDSGRYGRPYDCDEANEAYRREYDYQQERHEEERRAERRREEQRREEEFWIQQAEEEARQRADEEAYWEACYQAQMREGDPA